MYGIYTKLILYKTNLNNLIKIIIKSWALNYIQMIQQQYHKV